MSGVVVTGREADLLLFALDHYLGVDEAGRLQRAGHGFDQAAAQALRDKLFAAHEHEDEDDHRLLNAAAAVALTATLLGVLALAAAVAWKLCAS